VRRPSVVSILSFLLRGVGGDWVARNVLRLREAAHDAAGKKARALRPVLSGVATPCAPTTEPQVRRHDEPDRRDGLRPAKFNVLWLLFGIAFIAPLLVVGALHGLWIAVVAWKSWFLDQELGDPADEEVIKAQRGWFISVDSKLYEVYR
jgi:hypothetical protein